MKERDTIAREEVMRYIDGAKMGLRGEIGNESSTTISGMVH